MKKLRLNLDALAVESFEPAAGITLPIGTVRAREGADASDTCEGPNCPNCKCRDSTIA